MRLGFFGDIASGGNVHGELAACDGGYVGEAPLFIPGGGKPNLREALELTALLAQKDRPRSDRYRVRWLQRCLDEKAMSMEDVVLVTADGYEPLSTVRSDRAWVEALCGGRTP